MSDVKLRIVTPRRLLREVLQSSPVQTRLVESRPHCSTGERTFPTRRSSCGDCGLPSPHMLILAGQREAGGRVEEAVLSMSLPDLKPIQCSALAGSPMPLAMPSRGGGNRHRVEDGLVVETIPENRGAYVYRRRFDYLEPRMWAPRES